MSHVSCVMCQSISTHHPLLLPASSTVTCVSLSRLLLIFTCVSQSRRITPSPHSSSPGRTFVRRRPSVGLPCWTGSRPCPARAPRRPGNSPLNSGHQSCSTNQQSRRAGERGERGAREGERGRERAGRKDRMGGMGMGMGMGMEVRGEMGIRGDDYWRGGVLGREKGRERKGDTVRTVWEETGERGKRGERERGRARARGALWCSGAQAQFATSPPSPSVPFAQSHQDRQSRPPRCCVALYVFLAALLSAVVCCQPVHRIHTHHTRRTQHTNCTLFPPNQPRGRCQPAVVASPSLARTVDWERGRIRAVLAWSRLTSGRWFCGGLT